jgi:hypothetical protein
MLSRRFTIQSALSDYFQGTMGESRLRELIYQSEIPHWRNGNKIVLEEEDLDAWVRRQIQTKSGKKAQSLLIVVS